MHTKRFEKYSTHRNELNTSTYNCNTTKDKDSSGRELQRRSFIENTLKLKTATGITGKSIASTTTTGNISTATNNTTTINANSNANSNSNGSNFLSSKDVFNHKKLPESELSKIKILDKYLILVQNLPASMNSTSVSN